MQPKIVFPLPLSERLCCRQKAARVWEGDHLEQLELQAHISTNNKQFGIPLHALLLVQTLEANIAKACYRRITRQQNQAWTGDATVVGSVLVGDCKDQSVHTLLFPLLCWV